MKRLAVWIPLVAMFFALNLMFLHASWAQEPNQSQAGAWSLGVPTAVGSGFTGTEALVDVSGKVTKVEKMRAVRDSVQLRLTSDEGKKWVVWLGPRWFVDHQKIKFMVGDTVDVRGKAYLGNIITTEISKGEWTMKIRNEEDGLPNWVCCFPRQAK